jgi:hypothetical protein
VRAGPSERGVNFTTKRNATRGMLPRTKWTHTPNPLRRESNGSLLAATFNPPPLLLDSPSPRPKSTYSHRSALRSVLRAEFSPGSRLTRLRLVVIRIQTGSAPPIPRFIPLSVLARCLWISGAKVCALLRERALPPFFSPSFERRPVSNPFRRRNSHAACLVIERVYQEIT